ncbi:MAG: hypothetical protein ACPLQO_04865 [Desulfotomaculales bacterium]
MRSIYYAARDFIPLEIAVQVGEGINLENVVQNQTQGVFVR